MATSRTGSRARPTITRSPFFDSTRRRGFLHKIGKGGTTDFAVARNAEPAILGAGRHGAARVGRLRVRTKTGKARWIMLEITSRSLRFDPPAETREHALVSRSDRPGGPISRVVGLYQTLLRRTLEHFFPDVLLEIEGDRSVIDWDGASDETHYRITDDPDGLALDIEWLGTRLIFRPESPVPLLPLERRMVEVVVHALDLRFRGLFDQDLDDRLDRFQYVTEDLIVADFIGSTGPLSDTRRARSPASGRPLDLREQAGLDGGPAARDGPRPGRSGPAQHRGGPSVQRPADRDQGVPPALRRRPDALPRRPAGQPRADGRHRILGRQGPRERTPRAPLPPPLSEPREGDERRRPRLPDAHAQPGDQGLRRRDDAVHLHATPAGGCSTSPASSRRGSRRSGGRPIPTWPSGSSRPRST